MFAVLEGGASAAPVGNAVILTDDTHSSWAADLTRDPNNSETATGGCDPATRIGSRTVEFVGTSVTTLGGTDPDGCVAALQDNHCNDKHDQADGQRMRARPSVAKRSITFGRWGALRARRRR